LEDSYSDVTRLSTGQTPIPSTFPSSAEHMPPPAVPSLSRGKRSASLLSQSQIRAEEKQREQIAHLERMARGRARIKELEREMREG
jgi:hypothetical protein